MTRLLLSLLCAMVLVYAVLGFEIYSLVKGL